jgi:hypothetical protein
MRFAWNSAGEIRNLKRRCPFSSVNYFSHGFRFVDDPYVMAGTAVPDWLSVADRRVRARAARAKPLVGDPDPCVSAVARGVVQHHHDDGWFHNTDAFNEVCWQVTQHCRNALPQDEGFRPSFLGHILVEILLDAQLAAADPGLLDRYYAAMDQIDPLAVQAAVNQIAVVPTDALAWFIERFRQEQFLRDYVDDAKLLYRLNQVMRRVRLSPLPDSFQSLLPAARELVWARASDLIGQEVLTADLSK